MTITVTRQQYFSAVAQMGDMATLTQALPLDPNDPIWLEFWLADDVTEGDPLAIFTKNTFGWSNAQMTALFAAAGGVI